MVPSQRDRFPFASPTFRHIFQQKQDSHRKVSRPPSGDATSPRTRNEFWRHESFRHSQVHRTIRLSKAVCILRLQRGLRNMEEAFWKRLPAFFSNNPMEVWIDHLGLSECVPRCGLVQPSWPVSVGEDWTQICRMCGQRTRRCMPRWRRSNRRMELHLYI